MTGTDILFTAIQAFGGLALFIYGMTMLGNGLEKIAGGNLLIQMLSLLHR